MIRLDIPLYVKSRSNSRSHWAVQARRTKTERIAVIAAWRSVGSPLVEPPCAVELCRIGIRTLDSDNVRDALKAVRDEVAAILGVDDADPRVEWLYRQERGKPRVVIEIRPATEAAKEVR